MYMRKPIAIVITAATMAKFFILSKTTISHCSECVLIISAEVFLANTPSNPGSPKNFVTGPQPLLTSYPSNLSFRNDSSDVIIVLKIQALALLLISVLAIGEAPPNQLHVFVPGTAQPRVCETQDLQRDLAPRSAF